MPLQPELLSMDKPPQSLCVVTPERTRAGRPPIRIAAVEWVRGGLKGEGKPWGVNAVVHGRRLDSKANFYGLSNCYASVDEARAAVVRVANELMQYEQNRLTQLRTRLNVAKRASVELVE